MRRRLMLPGAAVCVLAAGALLASQPQAAAAATAPQPVGLLAAAGQTAVPSFGHVFVIVGENTALFQLTSKTAPYIMNTLRPESAWMTDYYSVVPGSLADYIALTSGQFAACQPHGPCGAKNVPSIFSQLGSGRWNDWNESMPSNCFPNKTGSDTTLNAYKPGHNPALDYAGLPCSTYDVPAGTMKPEDMSYFNAALANGSVPEYNFISPSLCEDSHDPCYGASKITEFDNFLRREIPLIEGSPAFGSNGVIFVTYDEGYATTHDERIMLAAIGPQIQTGSYSGYYDHYSTLTTIEQGLGLPCLANACSASALPIFASKPALPSVSITQPAGDSTISGTVTVAGTASPEGTASISQVEVSVDNGAPLVATGTTSWSVSIDTTGLTNGTHTISATVLDGNDMTGFAIITVNVGNPGATACRPCYERLWAPSP